MGICVSRLLCSADCLINYNIPGNKGGDGEPGEVTPDGVTSRLLPGPYDSVEELANRIVRTGIRQD